MKPTPSSSPADACLTDASAVNRALALAAQGDEASWRQLVQTYAKRVHGLIYRQCSDGDLAQEITQATFVQVVQHLKGYREQGRFEPWLFRIAMNRLRDEMRRRRRQARTFGHQPGEEDDAMTQMIDRGVGRRVAAGGWTAAERPSEAGTERVISGGAGELGALGVVVGGVGGIGGDPAELASQQEEYEQLRQAVAKLSPADRRIIELRHTAGLGFAEIAQTLGQPLGTVLARGHRALAKLKQLLTAPQAAED